MEEKENINNKTYESTIETIAGTMAVNKYNANKGKKINFEIEKSANEVEVINKINSIRSEMEGKIPGLTLPKNINYIIAEQMMIRMEPGVTEISQLDRESNFSNNVFEQEILPQLDIEEVKRIIAENERNGISNSYAGTQIDSMIEKAKLSEKGINLLELELPESLKELKDGLKLYIPETENEFTKYGEKVRYVVTCNDGSQITMTQPEDSSLMPSKEQAELTALIEGQKQNIINDKVDCRDNPKDKEKLTKFLNKYRENLKGIGFDAALLDIKDDIGYYGVGVLFDSNYPVYEEMFKILLEELEPSNAASKGFDDDSYSTMAKFEIMSQIYNYSKENPDNEKAKNALEKLKNIDPGLYELLEKDPQALEKLQTITKNNYYEEVVFALTGNADGTDKDEFISLIERTLEQNRDLDIDPKYIAKKVSFEREIKPEWDKTLERKLGKDNITLTDEEKIQNLSRSLSRMQETKGTEVATDFIINQLDNNKDKENVRKYFANASLNMLQNKEISYEESERKSRKKLFEKIIHEKNYDENILEKMMEIDSTSVKEILDDLLEMQNSRQEDKLGTIMDLSSKMKEVSGRKVITADKVDVKDIFENMVGKSDEREDGSEPEL